ncbi:NAD(P)-dependent oxidoreductase [Leifsonia sp. F6_8S_P_1B]|uniref:NAD(P)-dependent oxidoreductase n=1 Tax=Leifsonia williamsii TaxID=3035919 RepID=A0ABT8K5Z9_9MICO|nr:NAD(P)-dependent oxidoreductase [Leifsonia williamsii]MDN4612888.1 NAD(P)-dependent oxidoreductase [Leifsonia williamsii]
MTDADQTSASPLHVAVLGTGTMGAAVARTLLRDGFRVTVWNRTPERAEPLARPSDDAPGATVAASAAEAVAGADVVLAILFDGVAVEQVLAETADALRPGAVFVQCSTIGVEATARIVQEYGDRGFTLVEAMMLGTKGPAEQGRLVMLAGGDAAAVERIRPVLDAMGQKTVVAGDAVGAATRLKLAANAWIATITAGTAQSLALTKALGLDPRLFLQAIEGGQSDSAYAHIKGGAMLAGEFPPSFALDGLLKDVRLAADAAGAEGVATDLLAGLDAVYARASAEGHGGEDIAAVFRAF